MKAVQIKEYGAPEVLQFQEVADLTTPATGQARVRLVVAGLNYVDVYHRRDGAYIESLPFPLILGQEGAGIVEAIGAGVETVKVGDRVAYCMVFGSYTEAINVCYFPGTNDSVIIRLKNVFATAKEQGKKGNS